MLNSGPHLARPKTQKTRNVAWRNWLAVSIMLIMHSPLPGGSLVRRCHVGFRRLGVTHGTRFNGSTNAVRARAFIALFRIHVNAHLRGWHRRLTQGITIGKEIQALMTATPEIDLGPAESILDKIEEARRAAGGRVTTDDLIPLLQELQEAYGYLPPPVLMWVSERTGIPTSRMYGVITFYGQFYLEPHGKHTVTFCRGTSCHVRGGKKALDMTKSLLGIDDGETTDDMLFSLETVACVGACALSPVMVVDGKYYGKLTPRGAERVLRQLMQEESRKEY